MSNNLLDQYYNEAEFHLIFLDRNYVATTTKVDKKQIKDIPFLSQMKVKHISMDDQIFWEHTITPKELFGVNIKEIYLADKRMKNETHITRLITFIRK